MKHLILFLTACALAASTPADEKKAEPPKKTAGAPKKSAEPTPKSSVVSAKQTFKAAVELCDAPGRCEAGSRTLNREYMTMLQDSERRFVEACERCSSPERCEAERQRIREGKLSLSAAPCQ
jgi:hypothetical protein